MCWGKEPLLLLTRQHPLRLHPVFPLPPPPLPRIRVSGGASTLMEMMPEHNHRTVTGLGKPPGFPSPTPISSQAFRIKAKVSLRPLTFASPAELGTEGMLPRPGDAEIEARANLQSPLFLWASPGGSDGKEPACSTGDPASIPGLGRSPGGGHGNPLQDSCLENPQGQRSLLGCSPRDRRESDTTERLSHSHSSRPKRKRVGMHPHLR